MKRYKAILYFVAFLLLAASCGGPSNDEVKREFLKEHPNAIVLSIGPGEGDSGNVYMHIKYRLPGNNEEMEDEWLYQDLGGKKWENTWRKSTGHRKDRK
jgi:hypothetical protein